MWMSLEPILNARSLIKFIRVMGIDDLNDYNSASFLTRQRMR